MVWVGVLIKGVLDLECLSSCARFSTMFLKNCGRGEGLTTTTCPKTVVGVGKRMLPVDDFQPRFLRIVVEVKASPPPHVLKLCLVWTRECSMWMIFCHIS